MAWVGISSDWFNYIKIGSSYMPWKWQTLAYEFVSQKAKAGDIEFQ